MPLDEIELTEKITDHKNRIGSLEHRMKDAETILGEIRVIGLNLERLVVKAENTDTNIGNLTTDMAALKGKPAKRLDQITTAVIGALTGAIITAIVSAAFMALN